MADEHPDYGPRGYLPPRAAKRARKIILREPMGLQWAVAAVVAGVLVLVAGGVLLSRTGPPGPPFVAVGELEQVDPGGAGDLPVSDGRHVLVLRGTGGVTAFEAPDVPVAWCAPRSRLISPAGNVWQADGRLVGGTGRSLARLPAQVHGGVLYVDVSSPGARPAPESRGESSLCPGS